MLVHLTLDNSNKVPGNETCTFSYFNILLAISCIYVTYKLLQTEEDRLRKSLRPPKTPVEEPRKAPTPKTLVEEEEVARKRILKEESYLGNDLINEIISQAPQLIEDHLKRQISQIRNSALNSRAKEFRSQLPPINTSY